MRRKLLLSLSVALAAGCFDASADDAYMNVITRDGNTLTVTLDGYTSSAFWLDRGASGEDSVHLFAFTGYVIGGGLSGQPEVDPADPNSRILFDMPVSSISDITFTGNVNSLSAPLASRIGVNVAEGVLRVTGVEKSLRIIVSTIDGRMLVNRKIVADGEEDLKRFGEGIYCVTVGEASFKIMVK